MKSYEELIDDYEEARFALLMEKMMQYESVMLRERYVDTPIRDLEIDAQLDMKCRNVIERNLSVRRKRHGVAKTMLKCVLIAAVISCIAVSAACSFSPEFSKNIKRFITYQYEKFTTISFEEKQSVGYKSPLEDFALIASGGDSYETWFLFSSGEAWYDISVASYQEEIVYHIDTENASCRHIEIVGNDGMLVEKNGEYHVVIGDTQNNMIVTVFGHGISEDQIMEITKSVMQELPNIEYKER